MTAPIPEDGVDYLLCVGLLQRLDAADLATWLDSQAYGDSYGQVAGYFGRMPDMPDRAIALTPYPVSADPGEPMSRIGVQVRTRWAGSSARHVRNFAGAVFGELHGLGPVTLSTGVQLSQCLHQSGASMGQDTVRRWSHVDNYYCDVLYPTSHRS